MATDPHVEAERNAQFRLLVETVKDYAIFLLDTEGRVRSWNAGAERIKGYTAGEIIGKHFSTFYPAADLRRGKPDYALRTAAEEGRFEEEGWRVRKDGTPFWAGVVMTALRDRSGALVGYAKVTRDLSERKQADEQLRESLANERKARLENERMLERLRAIQSVTDVALAFLSLDDLLTALVERIAEALAVDTVAVLLLAPEGDVLVTRAALGLEDEVERGVRIPVGRGFAGRVAAERRPILIDDVEHADVLSPILREKGLRSLLGVPLLSGQRVLGVLHVGTLRPGRFGEGDVQLLQIVADRIAMSTEHARLYEAARHAEYQAASAEEALRVRNEFLSVAAHELKTPITSAKTAAQILRRTFRSTTLTEGQARALDTIEAQISKLARLVVQLLDTMRLESRALTTEPEDTDLAGLIRSVVEQHRPTSDRHEFVVSGQEHLRATLDPLRVEQVLTNLLDNAVKYSPDGGVIDVGLERKAGTAIVTVRDHGIGVAPEHRTRVFERFYQAHANRSGMGLGLYISRQIVEMHGGTIYAEFPADGGTRFVVSLPLVAAPPVRLAESVAAD